MAAAANLRLGALLQTVELFPGGGSGSGEPIPEAGERVASRFRVQLGGGLVVAIFVGK